jgi:hypothetical protein
MACAADKDVEATTGVIPSRKGVAATLLPPLVMGVEDGCSGVANAFGVRTTLDLGVTPEKSDWSNGVFSPPNKELCCLVKFNRF